MVRAYEEIIDFLAGGMTSAEVAAFEPSALSKAVVAELIHKEKSEGLSPDETRELEQYMQLEHLMRLAKAKAQLRCRQ